MGAWGYEPFENDAAGDWLDPIENMLAKAIRSALETVKPSRHFDGYHEAVAAAALLAESSALESRINLAYLAEKSGLFDLAIETVCEIENDAAYLAEWDKPNEARTALASLRRSLVGHRREAERQAAAAALRIRRVPVRKKKQATTA
jgi:hypothetical protein